MSSLVAEFSTWNSFELHAAFTQACKDVTQEGPVSVIDATFASASALQQIALAVFAADQSSIHNEPCSKALESLTKRQSEKVSIALGIATTGSLATPQSAAAIAASLGPEPRGAIREVVDAVDQSKLYDHIVRWLKLVIAMRPDGSELSGTLAGEDADIIADNLPTSTSEIVAPKLRSWQ